MPFQPASNPVGVAADSTRLVSAFGTPYAVGTRWSHGVVNLALPVHELVVRNSPYALCVVRVTAAYRGNVDQGTLVTSWSDDPAVTVTGGNYVAQTVGDTLFAVVNTTVACSCGVKTIPSNLTLVPEVP